MNFNFGCKCRWASQWLAVPAVNEATETMVSIIKTSIYARHGMDRAIWIALLCVVGTAIFSIALMQLFMGVLAVLSLVALVRSPSSSFRSTALDLPMLAFIIGRVLSVPFSVHPESSVHALYIEMVFYAAFFVFTNTVVLIGRMQCSFSFRCSC